MPSSFTTASGLLRSSDRPAPSQRQRVGAAAAVGQPERRVADDQLVVAGAGMEHVLAAAAGQEYRRPAPPISTSAAAVPVVVTGP